MTARLPQAACAAALLVFSSAAWAGPGHDHGDDAAPAVAGPVQPRAVASSDLFELVAVLDGQRVVVYLDRAATNEPMRDASVELEIAGRKLSLQRLQGDDGGVGGDFAVSLPEPLPTGVHPVTATVNAGGEMDLLAGELDIHDDHDHGDEAHGGWLGELRAHANVAVGGALAVAAAVVFGAVAWLRRRSVRTQGVA